MSAEALWVIAGLVLWLPMWALVWRFKGWRKLPNPKDG